MKKQMLQFGLSGFIGYVVDSVVLYAVMAAGMGFLRGRLISFVCAVLVTFFFNQRYTFAQQLQSTTTLRPPLHVEFGRYLLAMSLGGLLNLATYWFVLAITPHFPAIFALAVAAGSLTGMVVNFASAKWWVFMPRPRGVLRPVPMFALTTRKCLVIAQAMFWICHLHDMELPGLYMDAANPDYLAARTLNPELTNPVWIQPTALFPVLGNLYHGVQNYYVGLPVFAVLGFNMFALRVAQGLFGSGILVMAQLVLQRATGSLSWALAGSLGIATELAFIASFRTQMYIVTAGAFWLLLAVYLALGRNGALNSRTPWFLAGVCAGLAVYSYFVFLFFVPAFVIASWWHTRNWRVAMMFVAGFVLGMQTYVVGYALAVISMGGLTPTLEWIRAAAQDLGVMSAEQTFMQRLATAWLMIRITLQNAGNDLLIFGETSPTAWALWKMRLLVLAPLLLIASNIARRWNPQLVSADENRGILAGWHLALLPISFVAVSLIFGGRLWSHHYSPLVPVGYAVLVLAAWHLKSVTAMSAPRWVGAALVAAFVFGNMHQQNLFFDRLEQTGGVGRFSNAINRMADDALSMSPELVHVFPEWGFMIPFAFLTGNERRYEIDISSANSEGLVSEGRPLRLYYWSAETTNAYRDSLIALGYRISASGTYNQRDQKPAFYWMDAVIDGSAITGN